MTRPSGQMASVSASILTKLIALIAIVVAIVVGALAIYFPSRELRDLDAEQLARAETYGELVADEAHAGGALSDRETARAVLSSLDDDPDVAAVSLFDARGVELYRHGAPGDWVPRARTGVTALRVFRVGDRVAAVTPVAAKDGSSGTLVIELSLARLQAARSSLTVTALVAGGAALAFGAAAAYLIARSLVRRLRAIVDAAGAMPRATAPQMLAIDSADEIGALAEAFNHMMVRMYADRTQLGVTVTELTAAEDKLARANRDLEARVVRRTQALSEINRQLQHEMHQRSTVEVELRQAQKLESVGRLASGIAHEINTPVQFVSDSCAFLETAVTDVLAVIAGYRELVSKAARPEQVAAGRTIETTHDLDYLSEQIPLAIQRALLGLERVTAIVKAMKEFAYPDRKDQAPSDLNRAISSTLMVARNEYKYIAEVETSFGELPSVMCFVGELNQVFLNIVVNAAHAIEARHPSGGGKIRLETVVVGGDVRVTIQDNGCGIPDAVIDKIFDPFFTTKEIGKGSGQGLAIARAVVVDKHRGKLDVSSKVGEGTTFIITLPIRGLPETRGTQQAVALA